MQSRTYIVAAVGIAAAVIFFGAAKTRASEPSQSDLGSTKRCLRVSGTATVYAKPDNAIIELSVVKLAPRVADAKSACDQAMLRVQAAIRKNGVAAADIQTTNFQIYPVEPSKTNPTRQWKVAHTITVKVRKVDTVASVLDSAVSGGATNISQVSYSIEKLLDLRSKARAEAVRVAHEKAQELARLNNVQLGDPITINDSSYENFGAAQFAYNSSLDYPSVPRSSGNVMSQGQIAVDAREDIEFAIR
ncbi:MAG TPA: SIMPL domain-containing protein [Fimbriimonadaceae bacterium]|nr:SIMPL domain-containing protein [Fimbriimonadaceae bacterium]